MSLADEVAGMFAELSGYDRYEATLEQYAAWHIEAERARRAGQPGRDRREYNARNAEQKREWDRKAQRARRERLLAAGLGDELRRYGAENLRKHREAAKRGGPCVTCRKEPARPSRTECQGCALKSKQRYETRKAAA